MKSCLLLVLFTLLLTSCALTELASAPTNTPVASPAPAVVSTVVNTPGTANTLAPTRAATSVNTLVPSRTATSSAAATTPSASLNGASDVDVAKAFDGAEAYEIVRYFTSKELAGRKAGAPGADMAADYAAKKLQAAGLKPVGDNGTFFQTFTLPFIDLAEAPTLKLLNADGSVKREFKLRQDFSEIISGRATQGQADGKLVFLGRGTDQDLKLAGDLNNSVALIEVAPSTPRDLITRLATRGVAGILEVTGNAANLLVRFSYIPDNLIFDANSRAVLRVSRETADALLDGSATLASLDDQLNRNGAAYLATNNRVSLSLKLVPVRDAPTQNVIATIPGTDPTLANEYVIVGGHYDHVGADPGGAVFEGANDNASGSADVIALAEFFATNNIRAKRTLVFAAWTAEEAGLVGSRYYVGHPIFPLNRTKAYINLDVVGAGSGAGLIITNDPPSVAEVARRAAEDLNIAFGGGEIGGGSDHESFLQKGVPSTFFIWQRYGDIHVPSDSFDKIDVNKLKLTGQLAALTMLRIANQ